MCSPEFKIFNLTTAELSVVENKGIVSCARTALLVKALSLRNGCSEDLVSSLDIAAGLAKVKYGPHSAEFDDFAVSLPEGCPLLQKS